ncbi:hypothetical protein JCM5350_005995 [Sporobolomyces pararoseus]
MSWLGSIFGVTTTQEEATVDQPTTVANSATPSVAPSSIKVGVLLDGDADYFTHSYTSKGYRGGRSAALDLRNKIHHYILSKTSSPPQTQVEIVAFSFLNLHGLQSFLSSSGSGSGSSIDLRSFIQGFNSSPYAFSMSDVGPREQAADEAIKSHLPFLLSTCNYVLLGGTHDGGYSQTLLRLDPSSLHEKVLLLRTTSFCAERILELGLQEVRFEGLFEGRDPTNRSGGSTTRLSSSPTKRAIQPTTTTRPFSTFATPFQNLVDRLPPPPAPRTLPTPASPSISNASTSSSSTTPQVVLNAIPTTTHSTSLSSLPVDFSPLIQTLNYYYYSRSISQPRLVEVCQSMKKKHPYALKVLEGGKGRKEVEFEEFVKEAERRGIVKLYDSDLIELVRNSTAVGSGGSEKVKEKELESKPITPSPSSSSSSSSSPDFIPLISLLLSYATSSPTPIPRPLRAVIGEKLSKSKKPPFLAQPGQFKNYYEKAVERGLVRVGRGEIMGAEWIELGISLKEAREMCDKGTTNITISKEQEQIDSNPETSSSNRDISKFLPLLEVLVSHLPSNPKPEWTPIAGFIATYQPRPYGFEPGSFKRYVLEAENLGLIETGQVPGKEFNFWMKLKSSKEEVEELLRREKEKGKEGLFKSSKFTKVILPTLSTTNNSSRTTNTSDSVEVVDSRFYPLIKTLQELKTIKTDWGTVGEILLKNYHPRPYSPQTGGLKSHLLDAQDSGLVETGKMEGKEFDYWIKLNPNYQTFKVPTSSSQTTPSTRSITIPLKFLPLVQTISDSRFTQPYCSQIAAVLTNNVSPKPFEVGGWNSYLREAVQRGIVRIGVKGQGQEWVELREAVSLAVSSSSGGGANLKAQTQTSSSSASYSTHRPTPSSSSFISPSPSTSLSSAVTIPPALLQHWNSLYDSHAFSPLILTLNFIESSTTSSSESSFIPDETVKQYLEILPGGVNGAAKRIENYTGLKSAGYKPDELFKLYLCHAALSRIVHQTDEGVRLEEEYKGWKGR